MFMKWFPGSVLTKSFANLHLDQGFSQKLFLFLEAEYFTHKILRPKYWHVILKLAIFNGSNPLPSTTVKITCLLVSIKSLIY